MDCELFDFQNGRGPVSASRHRNPDGSVGGWVAATAVVAPTVHVGEHAQVFDFARVLDSVAIAGSARVFDFAYLADRARVDGSAVICDHAGSLMM